MSFFNFRNQDKFEDIAKILNQNEQTSRTNLHQKHPHTVHLFNKHDVDLKQIRKKGVKAAAAATVLGAFLAFPHLLGNPSVSEPRNELDARTLNIERGLEQGTKSPQANNRIQNSAGTSSTSIEPGSNPAVDNPEHKSQGHIHGRSYLAPPKEHGFHDLGLHKAEDKGKGNAESPGPHPEDLGINHPDKGDG